MSIPSRTIRRDTRVFISAVTRELGSVRKLVKKGLEDNDYHAVEQDNFPPDYRDLVDKLRERIDSCDAVVHIAGHCYGAEPRQRPPDAPRRSYTQLEYEIAVELGKPVYVFLTGDNFPTDPHVPEPSEFQELQEAHRRRLTSTGRDYNPTASIEQLDQKIRSLQLKVDQLGEELQQVDQQVAVHGGRLRRWLVALAVVSLAGLGTVGYVGWRQQVEHRAQEQEWTKQERERTEQERERIAAEAARKEAQTIQQVQQDFAERFLHQLLTDKQITAEDARQRALKELPALVKLPLAEIQSLIDRKIAPRATEKSLSSLDRAQAALAKGDYDEVFRAAGEQKRQGRELAMLEGTAALARFRQSPGPEWKRAPLPRSSGPWRWPIPTRRRSGKPGPTPRSQQPRCCVILPVMRKPNPCCGIASDSANPRAGRTSRESPWSSTTWPCCSRTRTGWRRPSRSIAGRWRSTRSRTVPTIPTSQQPSTTWRRCSRPRTGWVRPSP